jgi:hypothetical protein
MLMAGGFEHPCKNAGRLRDRSVSEGITGKSEALLQFGPPFS